MLELALAEVWGFMGPLSVLNKLGSNNPASSDKIAGKLSELRGGRVGWRPPPENKNGLIAFSSCRDAELLLESTSIKEEESERRE